MEETRRAWACNHEHGHLTNDTHESATLPAPADQLSRHAHKSRVLLVTVRAPQAHARTIHEHVRLGRAAIEHVVTVKSEGGKML